MTNRNGIHHVITDATSGGKSLCGKSVTVYDMPIDLSHGLACIEKGTYMQPCKRCMAAARRQGLMPS